jgi:hypothetical protein
MNRDAIILGMPWLASLFLALPQEPAILVKNPATANRDEVVRASLPLPRGRFKTLPWVKVGGKWAPTVPLVRWSDGSLAVVQLHPRVTLPAGARRRFKVELTPEGQPGNEALAWPLQGDIPIHTELEDPWGNVFRARFVPDTTAGPKGVLRSSSRVRVRRFRSVHRADAGKTSGTDKEPRLFFNLVAYLTTFAGENRAELTLVLENGDKPVIGPARFRRFVMVVERRQLLTRPRFIVENGLRPPELVDGRWRQTLLGPSDQLYLGDRTAKAWRFDLFLDHKGEDQEKRDAARLAAEFPLRPTPDVTWTRHTGAFGAHGGPAPGLGEETAESVWTRHRWGFHADFGPFGGFGDPRDAAANGTPRNGPSALHNVIRFGSGPLLGCAEGMVLQHCLRPTPGSGVRIPAETKKLRQGLSKRTMRRPHGFTAMDYEHFSADLLYDYYWLTGDALARDELARLGRGLRGVLSDLPFRTCRGEGWCMQAAVLISRATGDARPVQFVHKRFVESVEPTLGTDPAPYLIRQPPHPDALDGKEAFDCPWQMAALVHGAHAMFAQTGDTRYARLVVRAGRVMAGSGWLEDEGPKYFVSAAGADQYAMAVGIGPLEGTALMEVGAFVLAEEMAQKDSDRRTFRSRAETIFAPYEKAERDRTAMNTWFQLLLDRRARRR